MWCKMAQGKLRQLELVDWPLKLLNGRLTIRMPAGAKLEARHENIMSAAESAEEESRVVLDAGDERLIVMAYELLRTASKDFERQVKKMVDTWEMGGARIEARESRGFLISPAKLDLHKTAVPVLSVVMNHEDGLVQLLGFFVNRKAGADAAGCVKLARSIAATIAPGDKVLNLKGGPPRDWSIYRPSPRWICAHGAAWIRFYSLSAAEGGPFGSAEFPARGVYRRPPQLPPRA